MLFVGTEEIWTKTMRSKARPITSAKHWSCCDYELPTKTFWQSLLCGMVTQPRSKTPQELSPKNLQNYLPKMNKNKFGHWRILTKFSEKMSSQYPSLRMHEHWMSRCQYANLRMAVYAQNSIWGHHPRMPLEDPRPRRTLVYQMHQSEREDTSIMRVRGPQSKSEEANDS